VLALVSKSVERKQPEFLNVDTERLLESFHEQRKAAADDLEEVEQLQEEYQELSAAEEEDIEALLSRDNAIQDAAAFTENLSEELAHLDQANIRALMGSEVAILELMHGLDQAVREIGDMETKLEVYDQLLSGVRSTMAHLGSQYSATLVENRNLQALLREVDELVTKLDLDPRVEHTLLRTRLSETSSIKDWTLAATKLQEASDFELSPGVSILQAVTERKEYFSSLSFKFGRRLQEHLTGLFVQQAEQLKEDGSGRGLGLPVLPSHTVIHQTLLPYSALLCWMRQSEPQPFNEVMEMYVRSFRRVYEAEIRQFMADVKASLGAPVDLKRSKFLPKMTSNADLLRGSLGGSLLSLSPARDKGAFSQSVVDISASPTAAGTDSSKPRFDQLFSSVLEQLQPVCVAEQKFLTSFFHFQKPEVVTREEEEEEEGERGEEEDDTDFPFRQRQSPQVMHDSHSVGGGLQGLLSQLFQTLLPEIEGLILFGEKLDSFNSLYLLTAISHRLVISTESGAMMSELDETLKKALVCVRRLFDTFTASRKKAIEEMKVPKGGKCGVLSCVVMFGEFSERAESIIMGGDRRSELDKAYGHLIDSVFATIERVAKEHTKTPVDVVRFENYHQLMDILSRMKISCLERRKEEAKKKYRTHKKQYVDKSLGRPMEKLSQFFEGVEGLLAGGTKADEVGFRLDYSKTELKKCIKEYPGKEVKKGLEKLFRRVEREVSEEVLEVVWGDMQGCFMQQVARFNQLIQQCYSGAGIALEFNEGDVAEYFRSIAEQR
jgi:hypothetical protein